MPAGGPASVGGGDLELDQALTQILKLIGSLHAQLAATITEYGRSIWRACESGQERSG